MRVEKGFVYPTAGDDFVLETGPDGKDVYARIEAVVRVCDDGSFTVAVLNDPETEEASRGVFGGRLRRNHWLSFDQVRGLFICRRDGVADGADIPPREWKASHLAAYREGLKPGRLDPAEMTP